MESEQEAKGDAELIKTMKLYSDVDRIDNELRALGISDSANIDSMQLSRFDSMHYGGNGAVSECVNWFCSMCDNSESEEKNVLRVLDVGSGFGGPARLMVHSPCNDVKVVAVEMQEDIHQKASELTKRCQLDDTVTHFLGDLLEVDLDTVNGGTGSFDAVVSWLTFLHIPDKRRLLSICSQMLKYPSKGKNELCSVRPCMYVEDYYMREPFTSSEIESLEKDVYCNNLPTKEEYIKAIESSGFEEIVWEDKTADWTKFVQERLSSFRADKKRFVDIHGEATYERLLHFYNSTVALFEGGHLGGVRLRAKKAYK